MEESSTKCYCSRDPSAVRICWSVLQPTFELQFTNSPVHEEFIIRSNSLKKEWPTDGSKLGWPLQNRLDFDPFLASFSQVQKPPGNWKYLSYAEWITGSSRCFVLTTTPPHSDDRLAEGPYSTYRGQLEIMGLKPSSYRLECCDKVVKCL